MADSRVQYKKNAPFTGSSVVYVMSRDQRVQDNHALLTAQSIARQQGATLYVLFVLRPVKNRSREQYQFMTAGLSEVAKSLAVYRISLVIRSGNTVDEILSFCHEVSAGAVVCDFSPLTGPRKIVSELTQQFAGTVAVVDAHNIIPVWETSDKQEFAAHTIRTKIHKKLEAFLVEPPKLAVQTVVPKPVTTMSDEEIATFVQSMPACGIRSCFQPGEKAAHQQLSVFLDSTIASYAHQRSDIAHDQQSGLSPYLHFGQISSLRVALQTIAKAQATPLLLQQAKLSQPGEVPSTTDGMNALLEELIVRKELADNFCYYAENYTTLSAAPEWAQQSLAAHRHDPRDFLYTKTQWEAAETHDVIWNASQLELKKTGKMHGYMRMYWAKKLLEWSATPEDALQTAIMLNDTYSLDGGDPNGYVGILWSIAGLHDRPWFERSVYGKIRYMNDAGLRRKYDVDSYIRRVTEQ